MSALQRKRPGRGQPAPGAAYAQAFNALHGRSPKHTRQPGRPQGRFRRDWLPEPEAYYPEHLPSLCPSGNGWAAARCPFHDDTSPSLSVSLAHGGFKCWTGQCGATGGSVLDFHMRRYGMGFKDAARALGAWEGRP